MQASQKLFMFLQRNLSMPGKILGRNKSHGLNLTIITVQYLLFIILLYLFIIFIIVQFKQYIPL